MRPASAFKAIIVVSLVSLLAFSAIAKFLSGYPKESALPELGFWFVVGGELAVVGFFLAGRIRSGSLAIIGIAVGGIVVASVTDKPCGCFGRMVALSAYEHVILASGLGLAGTALLLLEPIAVRERDILGTPSANSPHAPR